MRHGRSVVVESGEIRDESVCDALCYALALALSHHNSPVVFRDFEDFESFCSVSDWHHSPPQTKRRNANNPTRATRSPSPTATNPPRTLVSLPLLSIMLDAVHTTVNSTS